ncbi:sulfate ABC transporter substrate-binding protein [Kineosporia sp. NBRC 101731]|uniref:sulfate ABC transporter substrate-binding protein n=1 Tax=Kineosporia sp. NBRC 101731 TaxID=3032199 RepID=UPI0024A19E12|nr:sulfate ABC transporter substrate-binding protein [Kineosporia sp. NBRC 101731]GLY31218.1 sulfate ABC transporter substrate-binding protein [Kineosporia sp. NBRC 101731]
MNVLRGRGRTTAVLALLAASSLGLSACGSNTSTGSSSGGSGGGSAKEIDIVGFSVIKSAYDDLGEAFAKTPDGEGVTFKSSYGASGAQARAVVAGQAADLVAFSLEPDLKKVVDAGKVDKEWKSVGDTEGINSSSVVVIAVRKGNPKNIKDWDDIAKSGIGIVTADPGTSGAAKWNLLGAYAQALGADNDTAAAQTYLKSFIGNVVSWNDSGRNATDAFLKGTGDVLISYENEAIAARAAGEELEYIVPDSTLLIENPGAVTSDAPEVTGKFLDYIRSTEGQTILAKDGFRPVVDGVTATDVEGANDPANPFPTVKNLTTIADLGGWDEVDDTFFGDNGIVTKLRK